MCVLNGKSKGQNDFTCIRPQSLSVVDYCFVPHDYLKYVIAFNVKRVKKLLNEMSTCPTNGYLDHSLLIADINMSDFSNIKLSNHKNECFIPYKYAKEYHVNNIPDNFMSSDQAVNGIADIIEYIGVEEPSQNMINIAYTRFLDILNTEMQELLPKVKHKRNGRNHRKHCPYWSDDLNIMFKVATEAERIFCRYKGNATERKLLHMNFKQKQKDFDVAFRKAKGNHNRQNEIEIESLINKNGKEMWQKIDQIGP